MADTLPRHVRKYVEKELILYQRHKLELENLRADILESTERPADITGRRAEGSHSNPTEVKGIRLEMDRYIFHLAKRIDEIERTYERLSLEEKHFVDLCYFTPRNETINNYRICQKMFISKTKLYRIKGEVLEKFAVAMALI